MSNTVKPVFGGRRLQSKVSGVSRIQTSSTCFKRHLPAEENISVPYYFRFGKFQCICINRGKCIYNCL